MATTILCGVDSSDAANLVADTADWLADQLGAHLVLAHAVEEPVEEAEELLAIVRSRLGLTADEDVRLLTGSPAQSLMDAAEHEDAELLVVGARGRGSLKSGVLGSVSRTLATSASVPVVIVPPEQSRRFTEAREGSAVVGVDGSDHSTKAALLAARLAERLRLRLVIVHALQTRGVVPSYVGRTSTPPWSAQPDAQRRLADEIIDSARIAAGADATGVVEPGRPWEVLESVAQREDGLLVCVAARGRGTVAASLFGSVALQLATSATRPVVILSEPAEAFLSPVAGHSGVADS